MKPQLANDVSGETSVIVGPARRNSPKAKKSLSQSRWQGAICGRHDQLIYGWAIDTQQPDARVVLELCVDGDVLGIVVADVHQVAMPDLGQQDPCHGFVAYIGELTTLEHGKISVRVANATQVLPGQIDLSLHQSAKRETTHFVFSDGALRLFGWAVDVERAQRKLEISAWEGAVRLAKAIADKEHPSLRSYQVGRHGFVLELPLHLADGQIHEIDVRDDEGLELVGSPIKLCYNGQSQLDLLVAGMETADRDLITNILNSYQALLPRGLGIDHYAEWAKKFDVGDELPLPDAKSNFRQQPAPLPIARIAVIVYGEDIEDRAELSLQEQLGIECTMIKTTANDLTNIVSQVRNGWFDAVALLRGGDSLRAAALARCWQAMQMCSAQISYSDSEYLADNAPATPWFKPAWNPEYALATDYPLELMLLRPELLPMGIETEFAIDAATILWHALSKAWDSAAIVHVPHVLYTFHSPLSEREIDARLVAAQASLAQLEPNSWLEPLALPDLPAEMSARRLQRTLPEAARGVKVSLIIPTRDQAAMLRRCIESLLKFTDWPNLEIIVVDNDSCEPETFAYFGQLKTQGIQVIPAPGRFNFSGINNLAVAHASGDVIGLVNNDIEALHDGWLDMMLADLWQEGVGAVGAKLLWPNGMVQHGGVVLGVGNVAAHFGNILSQDDLGDHARNQVSIQVSAVTAACMLLRKEDYLAVGGLNEHAFPVAFNDVDLCLKLRASGKSIIWCSQATLLHAESVSRGTENTPQKKARAQREITMLRQHWGHILLSDPAYHPSLSLDPHAHVFSGLALPPRSREPRIGNIFKK